MKAVRLHRYHELPKVEDVTEPKVTGPFDVIVRIGGAGLCRTDLHIIEGQWADRSGVTLPYTIGHENAGWVQEIGSAVSNVAGGGTVVLPPPISSGLFRGCPARSDFDCVNFPSPRVVAVSGLSHYLY